MAYGLHNSEINPHKKGQTKNELPEYGEKSFDVEGEITEKEFSESIFDGPITLYTITAENGKQFLGALPGHIITHPSLGDIINATIEWDYPIAYEHIEDRSIEKVRGWQRILSYELY